MSELERTSAGVCAGEELIPRLRFDEEVWTVC